jgi:sulfonate transport system substrate-binding protein
VRALGPVDARAAFASGEVDAWAVWNPHLASLKETLSTRVLRDARGLANNRAYYMGRHAFADAHPDVVQAFLGQVGAVGRWANESPGAAARTLAPHANLPASTLEASLSRTPFDTQPMNREAMASQQRIADTFRRLNIIPRSVDVEEAVWMPPPIIRRSA